MVHTRALGYNI